LKKMHHNLCSLSPNLVSPEQGCQGKEGLNPSSLVLARLNEEVIHHRRLQLYEKKNQHSHHEKDFTEYLLN